MSQNPFFKPEVYSLQFKICIDDAFNFTIKFIRKENGMVIVIKPNTSKIHLTLFIDNNEFESHITEESKTNIPIPYTEIKVPYGDLAANHLDYERYENTILKNLRDIKPKEKLYYINNPIQFYNKILSFLVKTKTYVIDFKKSSEGYRIEININLRENLLNKLLKLIKKNIGIIRARKLLKIFRIQRICLDEIKTRDGGSVILLHEKLYALIKNPIVHDLKNVDFQYYDFTSKFFDIIRKNLPGIEDDPTFKSIKTFVNELFKRGVWQKEIKSKT